MKKYLNLKVFVGLLAIVFFSNFSFTSTTSDGPQYASAKTKEVIQKMIMAHGGMEKWKKVKTFGFDNIMYNVLAKPPANPWWVSKVMVNSADKTVYQDWPVHRSTLAYDGQKVWSKGWKLGNAPKFETHFFYYFLNLPWLTQEKEVKLGEVKEVTVDKFPNPLYTVEMTYTKAPQAVGKTKLDSYKLYIDSKTYRLIAYEYSIGYGYMLDLFKLPKEKKVFGPMFRINAQFTEVDGLLFPRQMYTMNTTMTQTYGQHLIMNYRLNEKFDKRRLKMPANAKVDQSSHLRKTK